MTAPPGAHEGRDAPGPAAQPGVPAAMAAYRQADQRGREDLVVRHLPLVRLVAARLGLGLPPHIEIDDLHSYGLFGLLDALEKFDPLRGVRFETYAFARIKGAILDGLRAMDWVPVSLRQRQRDVEDAFGRVEARLGRSATDDEVADELGVSAAEFKRVLADIEHASLVSLDDLWGERGGAEHVLREVVADELATDPTVSAEGRDREEILAAAISALPERERTVVTLLYYDGLMAKEIAVILSVSLSRVSQLHARAVLRLRGMLGQTQRDLLPG